MSDKYKDLDSVFGDKYSDLDSVFGTPKQEKTTIGADLKMSAVNLDSSLYNAALRTRRVAKNLANKLTPFNFQAETDEEIAKKVKAQKNAMADQLNIDLAEDAQKDPGIVGTVVRTAPSVLATVAAAKASGGAALPLLVGSGLSWSNATNLEQDLIESGVDPKTAAKVRGVNFLSDLAGNFLPAGAVLSAGAAPVKNAVIRNSLIAGGIGGFNATQGGIADLMSGRILEGNKYTEQAKRFDPTNVNNRAAEFILGSAPTFAARTAVQRKDARIAQEATVKLDRLRSVSADPAPQATPKPATQTPEASNKIKVPESFLFPKKENNTAIFEVDRNSEIGKKYLAYLDSIRDEQGQLPLPLSNDLPLRQITPEATAENIIDTDGTFFRPAEQPDLFSSIETPARTPESLMAEEGALWGVPSARNDIVPRPLDPNIPAVMQNPNTGTVLQPQQPRPPALLDPRMGPPRTPEPAVPLDPTRPALPQSPTIPQTQAPQQPARPAAALLRRQGGYVNFGISEALSNAIQRLRQRQKSVGNAFNTVTPKDIVNQNERFLPIAKEDVKPKILASKNPDVKLPASGNLEAGPRSLALKTGHPLIRWWSNSISDATNAATSWVMDTLAPLADARARLNDAEFTEAMMVAREQDKAQKIYTDDQLISAGFNQNQISFLRSLKDVGDKVYDMENMARTALGDKPLDYREGHFPGMFRGDFSGFVLGKDSEGKYTKIRGVIKADSKAEYNRALAAYKDVFKGQDVLFSEMNRRNMGTYAKGDFDAGMEILLKMLGDSDPVIKEKLSKLQDRGYDAAKELFGVDKHELQKMGVMGAEGNKIWKTETQNANDAFDAFLKFVDESAFSNHYREPLKSAYELLGDSDIREKAPNAVKYIQDNINAVSGNRFEDSLGRWGQSLDHIVDSTVRAMTLGQLGPGRFKGMVAKNNKFWQSMYLNTVRHALVGQLQTIQTGIPMLNHIAKVNGDSFPLSTAMRNLSKGYIEGTIMSIYDKLPKQYQDRLDKLYGDYDYAKAVRFAKENGITGTYGPETVEDLARDPRANARDMIFLAAPKFAEVTTRPQVFFATYRSFKEAGMSTDDALSAAYNSTQFAMIDYHKIHAPLWSTKMGLTGDQSLRLRKYTVGYLAQMDYYARNDPGTLLKMMGILGLMGGLAGFPAANFVNELPEVVGLDPVSEYMKQFYTSVTGSKVEEDVAKNVPEWLDIAINYGIISQLLGADVSKSLGMGDIIPSPSDVAKAPNPIGTAAGAVFPYAGQPINLAMQAFNFVADDFSFDTGKRIARTLTPGQFGPMFDTAFSTMEKDGKLYILDSRGRNTGVEVTPKDQTYRDYGFRSLNESQRRAEYRKQAEAAYKLDRQLRDLGDQIRKKISRREYRLEEVQEMIEELKQASPVRGAGIAATSIKRGQSEGVEIYLDPEQRLLYRNTPESIGKWIELYGKPRNQSN